MARASSGRVLAGVRASTVTSRAPSSAADSSADRAVAPLPRIVTRRTVPGYTRRTAQTRPPTSVL